MDSRKQPASSRMGKQHCWLQNLNFYNTILLLCGEFLAAAATAPPTPSAPWPPTGPPHPGLRPLASGIKSGELTAMCGIGGGQSLPPAGQFCPPLGAGVRGRNHCGQLTGQDIAGTLRQAVRAPARETSSGAIERRQSGQPVGLLTALSPATGNDSRFGHGSIYSKNC